MRAAGLVLVLLAAACSPPPPVALDVRVSCAADGRALRQRCTVRLADRRTGRALEGATDERLREEARAPTEFIDVKAR